MKGTGWTRGGLAQRFRHIGRQFGPFDAPLRARQLVPIHYRRKPGPAYVETERAEAMAVAAGKRRGVAVQVVKPGDWVRA